MKKVSNIKSTKDLYKKLADYTNEYDNLSKKQETLQNAVFKRKSYKLKIQKIQDRIDILQDNINDIETQINDAQVQNYDKKGSKKASGSILDITLKNMSTNIKTKLYKYKPKTVQGLIKYNDVLAEQIIYYTEMLENIDKNNNPFFVLIKNKKIKIIKNKLDELNELIEANNKKIKDKRHGKLSYILKLLSPKKESQKEYQKEKSEVPSVKDIKDADKKNKKANKELDNAIKDVKTNEEDGEAMVAIKSYTAKKTEQQIQEDTASLNKTNLQFEDEHKNIKQLSDKPIKDKTKKTSMIALSTVEKAKISTKDLSNLGKLVKIQKGILQKISSIEANMIDEQDTSIHRVSEPITNKIVQKPTIIKEKSPKNIGLLGLLAGLIGFGGISLFQAVKGPKKAVVLYKLFNLSKNLLKTFVSGPLVMGKLVKYIAKTLGFFKKDVTKMVSKEVATVAAKAGIKTLSKKPGLLEKISTGTSNFVKKVSNSKAAKYISKKTAGIIDNVKNSKVSEFIVKKAKSVKKVVINTVEQLMSATRKIKKPLMHAVEKYTGKNTLKSLKYLAKRIPGLNILAGLGFGTQRALRGDWKGAGLEVLSGVVATLGDLIAVGTLGIGSAAAVAGNTASLGIDGYLAYRDMQNEVQAKSSDMKKLGITVPGIVKIPKPGSIEDLSQGSSKLVGPKTVSRFSGKPLRDVITNKVQEQNKRNISNNKTSSQNHNEKVKKIRHEAMERYINAVTLGEGDTTKTYFGVGKSNNLDIVYKYNKNQAYLWTKDDLIEKVQELKNGKKIELQESLIPKDNKHKNNNIVQAMSNKNNKEMTQHQMMAENTSMTPVSSNSTVITHTEAKQVIPSTSTAANYDNAVKFAEMFHGTPII